MTDATLEGGYATGSEFRMGQLLGRTFATLSRNFVPFVAVTTIASMPMYVILETVGVGASAPGAVSQEEALRVAAWAIFALILGVVLTTLSQAVVVYGAFQALLGRRVDLAASIRVGLARFLPALGVGLVVVLLGFLGIAALIAPGLIVFTRWSVATPACIVEKMGVAESVRRSSGLTQGHRWKIFALLLLVFIADLVVDSFIDPVLGSSVGGFAPLAGHVIWNGVWSAFYAILFVIAYHDLRVAKEGVDTAEIASVFE